MLNVGNGGDSDNGLPLVYRFQFGPFRFASEIDIPELSRLTGSGSLPVEIRLGGVPEDVAGAAGYGALCRVAPAEYLLKIPKVARFYVAGGSRVRVELFPGAVAADVSLFLLGSVFGALCHQNGLLPLHASAVQVEGNVTAFLGDSGMGKSTLAACLQGRGHAIVSDDICVLEPAGASDVLRVVPVAGWLKLWRASWNHLGETPEEGNRVLSTSDKYRLYLDGESHRQDGESHRHGQSGERPALRNLLFLSRAATEDEMPRLEPLATVETIALMMRLTYLGYITELTGSHARVFRQCAKALEGAKSYRLIVPWGFDRMDSVLNLLEETVLKA